MHDKHVALRAVQPRDDNELVANGDAVEAFTVGVLYFEPGIGRSLRTLPGCIRQAG